MTFPAGLAAPVAQRLAAGGGAPPIAVGVVGTGFFGSGLIRRLARVPGMRPAVVAARTPERAAGALRAAGVPAADIVACDRPDAAARALGQGRAVATGDPLLAARTPGVHVLMDAAGELELGAGLAAEAIDHGVHVVAANIETQATVGVALRRRADRAGVVYSDIAGDEPGMLAEMHDWCRALGFTPVLAGNCKGVMKRHATPETQAAFAAQYGLKPWLATAAADGTKLNLEMAAVANATGMPPARRGMTGIATSLDGLLPDLEAAGLLGRGPVVEYVMGIGNGVFMVVRADDDPGAATELAYLKMGDGPHYVLYRPNVMIHFEAPLSAARAVLYGAPTITPRPEATAEVVAVAKRDLPAGHRVDGIGGFDVYGEVERADVARADGMVPVGLARRARLVRPVRAGDVVRLAEAEIVEEDLVTRLRAEQDRPAGGPA